MYTVEYCRMYGCIVIPKWDSGDVHVHFLCPRKQLKFTFLRHKKLAYSAYLYTLYMQFAFRKKLAGKCCKYVVCCYYCVCVCVCVCVCNVCVRAWVCVNKCTNYTNVLLEAPSEILVHHTLDQAYQQVVFHKDVLLILQIWLEIGRRRL